MNRFLLEDVKIVNHKLKCLIPGDIELENESLRQNNEILRTVVQIYKQAEIDEATLQNENGGGTQVEEETRYKCNYCDFGSDSERELSVHIGVKHEEIEGIGENLIHF